MGIGDGKIITARARKILRQKKQDWVKEKEGCKGKRQGGPNILSFLFEVS